MDRQSVVGDTLVDTYISIETYANPPWYHPRITREESESRLHAGMLVPTNASFKSLFLVRKSQSSPKDFVISILTRGESRICHMVIEVTSNDDEHAPLFYTLDMTTPDVEALPQPHFHTMDALVDYYMKPGTGLPLQAYLSSPEYLDFKRALLSPKVPLAAPEPVPGLDQVTATLAEVSLPPLPPVSVPITQPIKEGSIIAEGYLSKLRGLGQTKNRYFRLTHSSFAFFAEEEGTLIDVIDVAKILTVSDVDTCNLRVITKEPFGASKNYCEALLLAPTMKIKERWYNAFKKQVGIGGGFRQTMGTLFAEGYLSKVQPLGQSNKTRWFALTDEHFAYYKEENGEIMGSVPLANIAKVVAVGNHEFRLCASEKFTRTGACEVLCRASNPNILQKWLRQLHLVLPPELFTSEK